MHCIWMNGSEIERKQKNERVNVLVEGRKKVKEHIC